MAGVGCCDSKPYGKPCGDCAFDTIPDVSDAQASAARSAQCCGSCSRPLEEERHAAAALSFAMASVRAQASAIQFWNVALVADTYMRSNRGPDHHETDDLVSEGRVLASISGGAETGHPYQEQRPRADSTLFEEDPGHFSGHGDPGIVFGEEPALPAAKEGYSGSLGAAADSATSERLKTEWKGILEELRVPRGQKPSPAGLSADDEDGPWIYSPPTTWGSSNKFSCKVKSWKFPKSARPKWRPGSYGADTTPRIGAWYDAEVVFDNEAPHRCACCVFRLFLKKAVGRGGSTKYGRDQSKSGKRVGGGRKDGSKMGDKDNGPEYAAVGGDGCTLSWDDSPIDPKANEFTYDYVGVVYDRCKNWEIRDIRRFLIHRKSKIEFFDDANKYVVTDEVFKATGDVGPEGWSHASGGKQPGKDVPKPPKKKTPKPK